MFISGVNTIDTRQSPDQFEDPQSPAEELASSLIHGAGVLLSIAGLCILLIISTRDPDAKKIVSFSVYGSSLILLYLSSTLHHSLNQPRLKKFFELMDHASIFVVIAGTYTPITLLAIRGAFGWTLFGIVWGLAILGIILKIFFLGRLLWLELSLYLGMGWLVVAAIKPLLTDAPFGLTLGLLVGGIFYTLGVVFFLWKSLPFHHTIWHVFVLCGSYAHFFAIVLFIA